MVKVYCDKCGKEIIDNVHTDIEETKAVGLDGAVVANWTKTFHYCNECQYNELSYGFKVGDKVITADGRVGIIESICDCEKCKERGFYEPSVKMTIGYSQIWISYNDKINGFENFYQIGNRVFGNINKQAVLDNIKWKQGVLRDINNELTELEVQLSIVRTLEVYSNEI